jgi:hypothetical protein
MLLKKKHAVIYGAAGSIGSAVVRSFAMAIPSNWETTRDRWLTFFPYLNGTLYHKLVFNLII